MLKHVVTTGEFSVDVIKPFSFRVKVMFQGTIRNDDF